MRWADFVLRLLLRSRDRDTISGDLLEEYREEVRPAKGPLAARLWYLRQVMSLMRGRFRDALLGGILVGTGTMAVLHLAAIVRVNMFLPS